MLNLEDDHGSRKEFQKARCARLGNKTVDGTRYKDVEETREKKNVVELFFTPIYNGSSPGGYS